jgi:NADH dehydrogenase
MTILVSGATGFVGSAITRHLLAAGYHVRAMSRSSAKAAAKLATDPDMRDAQAEGRLTFIEADVTEPSSLGAAVADAGVIIQAAQFQGAPVEDPARGLTYERVDRDGTRNLLSAVMSRDPSSSPPHFLYMSGITVSATAREPWNRAKWQAEESIRASGLTWTIVRGCWAYGPNDAALNRILHYSDHLPFVPIFGSGDEPLSPLFVEDIGRFFALLVAHPERSSNTTFGLGGPDTITLVEFLHLALRALGRRRPIFGIPKSIGKVQAALIQHLPGRPLTPDAVDFVSQGGALSEDQRRLLEERFPAFEPTPVGEGLASYMPMYFA